MKKLEKTRTPGGGACLRVVPLGGLGEFGKNMMMLEYGPDAIVLDMGFAFPGPDQPGVDYLIPDPEYLVQRRHKIRGIIVTHGHMDHIGAAPFVLSRLPVPVYGTRLTLAMVAKQVAEYGLKPDLRELNPERHEIVRLGAFEVELVRVNHSIADAAAVVIRTPVGTVIDTGDWRYDPEPVDGLNMDFDRLRQLGDEGVLLLMGESSNCDRAGRTPSERVVVPALNEIFEQASGRIFISAFSTSTHRLQLIADAAVKSGRRMVLLGRSMVGSSAVYQDLGVLKVPSGWLVEPKQARSIPPEQLLVVCTGSQGEENSVLWRLASGAHPNFELNSTDTVVFSSSVIPGNQAKVNGLHDRLMRRGVRVYAHQTAVLDGHGPLHVTGHGSRDDVEDLIRLVRPKFLMPIHGDYAHMIRHSEVAVLAGMKTEQIQILANGDVLELDDASAQLGEREQVRVMSVSSGQVQPAYQQLFEDRKELRAEGVVLVTLNIRAGKLAKWPGVITRGFVRQSDNPELLREIAAVAQRAYYHGPRGKASKADAVREAVESVVALTGRGPRVVVSLS